MIITHITTRILLQLDLIVMMEKYLSASFVEWGDLHENYTKLWSNNLLKDQQSTSS